MRVSSMARQRVLTLLALTSLVAIMVTLTRYSTGLGEPTAVRLMLSQQRLIEYQQRLRLIASENNSNHTINNLLETLIQTKTSDDSAGAQAVKDQSAPREGQPSPASVSSSPHHNSLDSVVPI